MKNFEIGSQKVTKRIEIEIDRIACAFKMQTLVVERLLSCFFISLNGSQIIFIYFFDPIIFISLSLEIVVQKPNDKIKDR